MQLYNWTLITRYQHPNYTLKYFLNWPVVCKSAPYNRCCLHAPYRVQLGTARVQLYNWTLITRYQHPNYTLKYFVTWSVGCKAAPYNRCCLHAPYRVQLSTLRVHLYNWTLITCHQYPTCTIKYFVTWSLGCKSAPYLHPIRCNWAP